MLKSSPSALTSMFLFCLLVAREDPLFLGIITQHSILGLATSTLISHTVNYTRKKQDFIIHLQATLNC
jgi:hypothetical protein